MAFRNVTRYLLGSNEKLELLVLIENLGEDSFETTMKLQLPEGVDFNKIIEVDTNEARISCSEGRNNTVLCEIGNPLPASKIVSNEISGNNYQ